VRTGRTLASCPDSELVTLNDTESVPKKSFSVSTTAPLTQPWPDGWSGNAGVVSGAGC
jgi:hypothetical protein